MIIGSHCNMNAPDMMLGSVKEALSYGANALMIYTGAPQNTLRRPLETLKIIEALQLMKENNIDVKNFIIHAPYIINPATSDLEKRDFCIKFLSEEINRTFAMGAKTIVLHPGNALGLEPSLAINNICTVLNEVIAKTKDKDVVIALETMAGKGTEVGRTFEEIKQLLDGVIEKERVGVCLDTCHIYDAGYDIVNDYENVKNMFNNIIGFDKLRVIHLNDSKNTLASHKDRHSNIGSGNIGYNTLKRILFDDDFKSIPKILETPYINGVPPYKEEIEMLIK